MNMNKLICILIAVPVIISLITVGLVAKEDKQSDGKENVEYVDKEQRKHESKNVEKEKEVRYRGLGDSPGMHSPEPDPGEDPNDPKLDSSEDTK